MDNHLPFPHDIMLKLLTLRMRSDKYLFIEELYQALTGELKEWIGPVRPGDPVHAAIGIMIRYFQDKEEYEKCARLKILMIA
jgi:hypothetical protein